MNVPLPTNSCPQSGVSPIEHGFDVRLAERMPCNDGGISYGQVIEAHAKLA